MMRSMPGSGGTVSFLASDVGVWMALPAFAPALVVAAVVIYVMRRDRRADPDDAPQDERDAGQYA